MSRCLNKSVGEKFGGKIDGHEQEISSRRLSSKHFAQVDLHADL